MKITLRLFFVLTGILLMFTACRNCLRDCETGYCKGNTCVCDPGYTGENCDMLVSGGSSGSGQVVFWTNQDYMCGFITVTINGTSENISSYYYSAPDCNAQGCATFSLPAGSYSYSAVCSGYSMSGNVYVPANSCIRRQLIP